MMTGVPRDAGLPTGMAENYRPLSIFPGSNSMTPIFIISPTVPQKHKVLLSFPFLPLDMLFLLPILGAQLEELLLGSNSKSSSCETFHDILLHRHVATTCLVLILIIRTYK